MGYHSVAITSLHSRPPSALDLYCVSPLPAQVITKLRQRPKVGDFMSKKGEFSQRKSRKFVDQKTDVIEFDFQTVNCSTKHGEDCQKKYSSLWVQSTCQVRPTPGPN